MMMHATSDLLRLSLTYHMLISMQGCEAGLPQLQQGSTLGSCTAALQLSHTQTLPLQLTKRQHVSM